MKFVHTFIEESRISKVVEAENEQEARENGVYGGNVEQTLETRRTRVEVSPLEEVSAAQVVDEENTADKLQ